MSWNFVQEYWVTSAQYALLLVEDRQTQQNPMSIVGLAVLADASDRNSPIIGRIVDAIPDLARLKIQRTTLVSVAELLEAGVDFDDLIFPESPSNPKEHSSSDGRLRSAPGSQAAPARRP